MKRSLAVTLSAVLSLLGSTLTLLIGVLMFLLFVFVTPPSKDFAGSPAAFKAVLCLASLIYILPAIWGILTSIGLFRLKNWARISMIVFSVILVLMSGCTLAVTALVPIPAARVVDQSTIATVRTGMEIFWLVLAAIGVWWLVLFMRPGVKAQFVPTRAAIEQGVGQPALTAQAGAPGVRSRPLSITIIAWLLLVGCVFIPLNVVIHVPAVLFTKILIGSAATVCFLVFVILNLAIGIGLLRLNATAWTASIAYYSFALLNMGTFFLAPGGQGRMQALVGATRSAFPWMELVQRTNPQFDPAPFMTVGGVLGALGALVPLYFLITRRNAFLPAKQGAAS